MNINMDSVMSKVKAFSESSEGKMRVKNCLEKYKKEGRHTTATGDKLMTETMMREAAYKFIDVLKNTAHGMNLPESVLRHFDSLDCSNPIQMRDGSSIMYVYFADDLHRESLQPERYDGVDNIVAVLNNGYDRHENMAKVWGEWHDMRNHGMVERTGLRFIQRAVDTFNGNYGSEYNVTAFAGDEYS